MKNAQLILGGIGIGLAIGYLTRKRAYESIIKGEPQSFDNEIALAKRHAIIGASLGAVIIAAALLKK